MINVSSNITSTVTVKDEKGMVIQVAYLSASLDAVNKNFNIAMNVINKDLVENNGAIVKAQYAEFITYVKNNAKELGYIIF